MELTNPVSEFDPQPIAPKPLLEGPIDALLEWQAMAEGAYSANTLRAQKADGAIFQAFCESRSEPYLPADPNTIRAFIDDRVKAGKKPATVKRYVATIARVHIAAGLLNPCSSEAVRLGLGLGFKSVTSIPFRMGRARRSFGSATPMRRGRGGWLTYRGDREMAESVAGTLEDRGGGGISSSDWAKRGRRTVKSRERCSDLQADGAVDWNARAEC
jgi:hypothetical protein